MGWERLAFETQARARNQNAMAQAANRERGPYDRIQDGDGLRKHTAVNAEAVAEMLSNIPSNRLFCARAVPPLSSAEQSTEER